MRKLFVVIGAALSLVSASCRLDFRGRFGAFVSAPQNRVSRQRRPVWAETQFACWVSAIAAVHESGFGPKQTCCDVRCESVIGGKADVTATLAFVRT
jgi:hypothetical protein